MILISGATGNVGRGLVERLLAQNVALRLLVRDPAKVAHLPKRVERCVGDLDRPQTLASAMEGVEQLFFVTPVTEQVESLVNCARQAGVRHVVKLSTIEADRSIGPGKWHRQQEELIRQSGMDWTFLRPTMMMVNTIEWWGASIKTRSAIYFPGGSGRVAPVDERDVSAAAAAVLTGSGHTGQTYALTGPQSLNIAEMADTLAKTLGRPIRYVNIPAFLAALWMRRFGLPPYVVRGLMETLKSLRRSEYASVTDGVERTAGITPGSFADWCRDHAAAFQ